MAAGFRPQQLNRLPFLALLALAGCVTQSGPIAQNAPGAPQLFPVAVTALPGWADDDSAAALAVFIRGCKAIEIMPPDQPLGGIGLSQQTAGQAGLWQNACANAQATPPGDEAAARGFFTQNFTAYRIGGDARITGYFEPEVDGSKNPTPADDVPLYAKPADPDLASLTRAQIDGGGLYRKTPVTAYLADPVDAYMLQSQGAGRIVLENGQVLRVGFDGQNGQPYTPIGRVLVQQGAIAPGGANYQAISTWLKAHPDQAQQVMEQNARYVYMRPVGYLPDDEGAPGALGVSTTAGRTLAVDQAAIPLGTPVFLATTDPISNTTFDRLTVAQDIDGGMPSANVADLFFGAGAEAETAAERMQQSGTLYLLLPKPPASNP